jgi:hypothetical protein
MFSSLDMTKKMYFSDGSSFDFQTAQRKLAQEIGLSPFSESKDIEAKIFNALKNSSYQLASSSSINEEEQKVMGGFYRWVQSIHNDKLVPPTGARFPNNIVYDILSKLRSKSDLNPEQTLLRFFLEGANGRKISKGKTPSIDFIATSLILDAINAAEKLDAVSSKHQQFKHQQFKNEYESVMNYIEPQRKLESAATQIKSNPAYGLLFDQKVFEFEKENNEETGANRYLTHKATEKGVKVLGEQKEKLDAEIAQMVNSIKSIIEEISPVFVTAQKSATKAADLLGKWDASEWAARFYTALSIAARHDSKHQAALNEFRSNLFFGDVLLRNEKGDYPANERNKAIEHLDITQLFTQAKLAEQGASPIIYYIPKDSPLAPTSSSSANSNEPDNSIRNTTSMLPTYY